MEDESFLKSHLHDPKYEGWHFHYHLSLSIQLPSNSLLRRAMSDSFAFVFLKRTPREKGRIVNIGVCAYQMEDETEA